MANEIKVSERTAKVVEALNVANQLSDVVSDYLHQMYGNEDGDKHFDDYVEKFISPMTDWLEEEMMTSIRDNRSWTSNKGELL